MIKKLLKIQQLFEINLYVNHDSNSTAHRYTQDIILSQMMLEAHLEHLK